MLRKILNVTGKPGLYRLVATPKNMLIVESLADGKRIPVYARDKVVSLADVSMYTEEGDKPLAEILEEVRKKENGATVDVKAVEAGAGSLMGYFAEVVPDFDRDRVHNSDIRKMLQWYNILIAAPEFAETFIEAEPEADDEKGTDAE